MAQFLPRIILILEAEPVIGKELTASLEAAGFRNIEVIDSVAGAEVWVMNRTPSVAIVDIELKDGSSAGIAQTLTGRGVPMIVSSGVPKKDTDPAFQSSIWVRKPWAPAEMIAAIYSTWDLLLD
jgi:DNA-binding response OmpR family regulator